MQKGHYQWIFVLFLLAGAQLSYAQGVRFSGKVVDKQTGEPLQGAVVYIHETGKHSVCKEDGTFSLDNLKPAVYHIHASMLSYEPFAQNFRVVKDTIVIIAMEPTSIELKNFTIESEMVKTEAVKSPLSIESANREFIEKQSGNTFINALEKIPGISSINVGVGISKPVIRGMSFNRVVVTENGIKQEGQQWGADHGLEIDQFNVERVEILKGPSSLIYGSDALGGVINILPPAIPLEGRLNVHTLAFYRSNNDAIGGSAMLEGRQKKCFFRVRGTWQEFGDYKVPAAEFIYNTYRLPIYNNRLKNTSGKELNFSVTAGLLRDWGMIRFTYSDFSQTMGFFPGAMGIPRAYNLQHDGNYRNIGIPNQSIFHRKFILNFNIKTRKGWLENDLGYQINYRTERSAPHKHGVGYIDPQNTTALGLDLYTFSINSRWHNFISEKLKNITGFQIQHSTNQGYGYEFLIPNYILQTAGLYTLFTWEKTTKNTYTLGLRSDVSSVKQEEHYQVFYDQNNTIIGTQYRSPDFQKVYYNWSLAAGASWELAHEWNLKLHLGRAFRLPTAAELGANGVHHGSFRHEMGDTTLRPEVGYQLDLGLIHHENNYIIKFTPFLNYFTNYLFLRPGAEFSPLPDAGQLYRYTQAEVIMTGAELYTEYHIVKNLHLEFAAEYVYNLNLDQFLPLPFTPPGSFMISPEFTKQRKGKLAEWFIASDIKYFLAQNRTDRNEMQTPGYFLISAAGGVKLHFKSWNCELIVKGANLSNVRYFNHLSRYRILNLPEQGRNFSITLKIPLDYSLLRSKTP